MVSSNTVAKEYETERCSTPLRYVAGISWPRSGHHLLVRLMSDYFGDAFNYCEFYTEHLDCCRQFPCTRAKSVSFSKNHDFALDVSTAENVPYLVQYRNFFNSVVSEFELHIRVHGADCDTKEEFEKHSVAKARQFKRFRQKWVDCDTRANVLLVPFEDLISNTEALASLCIQHFMPGTDVDLERLREVISNVDGEKVENCAITKLPNIGVHKSRDFRAFRHYDDQWHETISAILDV